MSIGAPVLEVHDLVTRFHTDLGVVHAVNGVSFEVGEGEAIAIVGESGSGKSATAMSVMGLIRGRTGEVAEGRALLNGRDLLQLSERETRAVRGPEVAMVFQDPSTSLNPVLTIGRQLTEALRHHARMGRSEARARAVELMEMVGIPAADSRMNQQ